MDRCSGKKKASDDGPVVTLKWEVGKWLLNEPPKLGAAMDKLKQAAILVYRSRKREVIKPQEFL